MLELLIKLLFLIFPSRYYFTIAYISYLALEEGSPIFKQILIHFTLKAFLFSFTLIIESRLIFIPEVSKIFQFTSFINRISPKVHDNMSIINFLIYSCISVIVSLYTCHHTLGRDLASWWSFTLHIKYITNVICLNSRFSGHYDSNITTPQPKWGA